MSTKATKREAEIALSYANIYLRPINPSISDLVIAAKHIGSAAAILGEDENRVMASKILLDNRTNAAEYYYTRVEKGN